MNTYPKYLKNPRFNIYYKIMNPYLGFAITILSIKNIAEIHLDSDVIKSTKAEVDAAFKGYVKNLEMSYRGMDMVSLDDNTPTELLENL